jgi:hypothetical protein
VLVKRFDKIFLSPIVEHSSIRSNRSFMVPGITLNRRSLTLLIALSILVPVGFGLGLALWMRKIPEPPLEALVRLDVVWIEPKTDRQAQRLVPAISVRNTTMESWRNLSIGLNKQFYPARRLPCLSKHSSPATVVSASRRTNKRSSM